MLHLSGGEWVVAIVVAVVGAIIGYRLSEADRRTLGRTPWGLPSLVWALFWFLSLLLGLVLYLIAHSNGVRRAQHGPPAAYPGAGRAPVGTGAGGARTVSVAEQFPAYPQPANVRRDRPEPESGGPGGGSGPGGPELVEPVEPTGSMEPGTAEVHRQPASWPHSPPAWHPDPSGRFHFRWWDGHQWTSQVSTDGHHLIDTNSDQRIGPY
ncbi:MAG: DUF2510 domain-containing protein [Acidimicrobiales bacterium]